MCSLDNRKGKLYWKTTATFTRPSEGQVGQQTTRLTTNQEMAGSNPAMLGDCLFTPIILMFDETEQDSPVDTHQKTFAATKRRENQSAGMSVHGTSEMNHESLAKLVGARKETAGKTARFSEHRLPISLLNHKESVYRPFESVGNQHCP